MFVEDTTRPRMRLLTLPWTKRVTMFILMRLVSRCFSGTFVNIAIAFYMLDLMVVSEEKKAWLESVSGFKSARHSGHMSSVLMLQEFQCLWILWVLIFRNWSSESRSAGDYSRCSTNFGNGTWQPKLSVWDGRFPFSDCDFFCFVCRCIFCDVSFPRGYLHDAESIKQKSSSM